MRTVEVVETSTVKEANTTIDSSKESVKINEDNQKVEQVQESEDKTQSKELVRADADIPQTGHESVLPTYMLGMSTMLFLITLVSVIRKKMKLGEVHGKQ